MRNNLVAAVLLPIAFYLGSRWGIVGIAATWLVAHPIVLLPMYNRVFRRIELPTGQYLKALWPALSTSAIMALIVVTVDLVAPAEWPPIAVFVAQVLGGGAVFAAVLGTLYRERVRTLVALLKRTSR